MKREREKERKRRFGVNAIISHHSRAHYWVNKYILKNACELQRVVLYFKELFNFCLQGLSYDLSKLSDVFTPFFRP